MTVIGLDKDTSIGYMENRTVDLGKYNDLDEKYVHAVDNKVELIVTKDRAVAEFFKKNGISALIKV